MQSCDMSARAFDELRRAEAERPVKIHHEHLANGQVRVKEVFTGHLDRAIHDAMDKRRSQLEAAGGRNFRRTRIGRNSPCPCGSGRKLKKCCIGYATPA